MSIDTVLAELRSMYRAELEGSDAPIARLRNADIDRWSANLGITRLALYDLIAHHLAFGFYRNELAFGFCDRVVGDIHGVISVADEPRPALFWSVFLAFDAGEYYRHNDRSEDPVAKYTRSLIAQVVDTYGSP